MPVVELKWQYGKGIHWLNHIQRVAERKQVFNEDTRFSLGARKVSNFAKDLRAVYGLRMLK